MSRDRIDNVLRDFVRRSPSLNALSRESGVPLSSLSRFVNERRDIRLLSASKLIDTLGLDLTLIRFLREPGGVDAALESAVADAVEYINAVGGRARSEPYLRAIETAVTERNVSYARLVTGCPSPFRPGSGISHAMHEHLQRLRDAPSRRVRIRQTQKDYFTHLTVTDRECVILLPAGSTESYFGVRLTGYSHSLGFSLYFSEIFGAHDDEAGRLGKDESLAELCRVCRDAPAHDAPTG